MSCCNNNPVPNQCDNHCRCGLKTVVIPATLGDETSVYGPKDGKYTNTIVKYEASGSVYIYDRDGVFTKIGG